MMIVGQLPGRAFPPSIVEGRQKKVDIEVGGDMTEYDLPAIG